MTNSQRQVVWLCGKQASGKTFAGDYLQTRGWHHVDGDLGKTSDDAAVHWLAERKKGLTGQFLAIYDLCVIDDGPFENSLARRAARACVAAGRRQARHIY